jgi:NADH dehydrogenase
MAQVTIVGAGFAGLRAAKGLMDVPGIDVTLVDARNHHLFQPLLYQVAMAGLSPAEIAAPIRSILSGARNVRVLQARVDRIDLDARRVETADGAHAYDYLVLACGARHSYFGHPEWEEHAPGLKTVAQSIEIRRRVLCAFEEAEKTDDPSLRKALLTFVVVGGGPTGVELAGAIGEMSRFTLARDFRQIDPAAARVVLIEAGPRILPMFSEPLSARAIRDLSGLGVEVRTESLVTAIDAEGVCMGAERIEARTVLWAAGVEASSLNRDLDSELDSNGRVVVEADLSIRGHPEVFVAGDQANVKGEDGRPLPGVAPVAMQQGAYLADRIRALVDSGEAPAPGGHAPFVYVDKGQMATIGRGRAVLESGRIRLTGLTAWIAWLIVHIYYLVGFKNRLFVVLQWAWAYLTFRRGARLIVDREWRDHEESGGASSS